MMTDENGTAGLLPSTEPLPANVRCGFIGLIGRPNVGKSTLLNRLIGCEVSITASKPQTTRNRILGIRTNANIQMVFIDTPGIHSSEKLLNRKMVESALLTLKETDLNLWLVEPIREGEDTLLADDAMILNQFSGALGNTLLAINKTDLASPLQVLKTIDVFSKAASFEEIVPVSALKSHNLEHLLETIEHRLPEHPFYFEPGQVTDSSERFLVSELVREQVFRLLHQELPYATAVQVEQFDYESNCLRIGCTICVERDSQKGILIGRKGAMLKQIGTSARRKIERLLGGRVFLALHVKVLKHWTRKPHHLHSLGFN